MDNEHTPTAEELAAEQAAIAPPKEEEVKTKVMEDFGFDESTDPVIVDKAVKKELAHRESLSTAIRQKIKHRTDAETLRKGVTPPKDQQPVGLKSEDVDAAVEKKLQQRDLDAIEASPELKKEIQRVADIKGISITQAARDPYIAHQLDAEEKTRESDEASISRKNRGNTKKKFDPTTPPDSDMTTAEGRKEYEDWKAEAIKQGY